MSIEFSSEDKDGYLLIKTHGESPDINVVHELATDVFTHCKESGYSSILIDERDREYNLTEVLDQYKMANFLSALDLSKLRIAFVCQEKYQEQIHFLEITAQNRGLAIKFFIDPDSAKKWLL
jgi:hypothetical protein